MNGIIGFLVSSLTVRRLLLGICNAFKNPVFTTCIGYFLSIKDEANSFRRTLRTLISETMVQILRAKENGMLTFVCFGWHDLKFRYCLDSDRKYPIQVVKTGFLKALQIPRSSLLTVKEETKKPIIPFISTHNPKNRELFGLLKSNFTILKQDKKMNKIINETKFIKCKRQPPNLKHIITRSEFKEETTAYVRKCGESRCGLCDYIVEGNSINLNNKTFHVKENMDCTVKNVIYVLICNGCREFYIGQTGDKLRNRKTVHIQQVRDPLTRQMPLSAHLDTCCKTCPKFSIFPFFKMQNDNVSSRLSKEEYFIMIYKPKLNVK